MSVGMILDSTRETMRVTRNPSDHSANFGRGAHTYFLSNVESVISIKLMLSLLCSSYGIYYYHNLVANFVKSDNYTKVR